MARHFAVLALLFCAAISPASVQWEKPISWPVYQSCSLDTFQKDAFGNLYAIGWKGGQVVFKFSPSGQLLYTKPIPTSTYTKPALAFGPGDDFYVIGNETSRFDGATGNPFWTVDNADGYWSAYTDDAGDLYSYRAYPPQLEKRSLFDGHLIYSKDYTIIPMAGPTFLAYNNTEGLFVAAKDNGSKVKSVVLTPAPTGAISGIATGNGNALLFSEGRAYGYRAVGNPINLGTAYANPSLAGDGSFLVSSGNNLVRLDSSFHPTWTRPGAGAVRYADANEILLSTSEITQVVDLASGVTRLSVGGSTGPAVKHAGQIWTTTFENPEVVLSKFDDTSGVLNSQWRLSHIGPGSGAVLAGGFGPFGDLVLFTQRGSDSYIIRISAAGNVRWSLRLPNTGGGVYSRFLGAPVGMSFSADKSVGSVYHVNSKGSFTWEFDAVTGQLRNTFAGVGCVAGSSAYRSGSRYTSKFDLATGRELWRVPRTGHVTVGPAGEVYIGRTRNRNDNGSLVWTSPEDVTDLYPLGDRVLGHIQYGGVAYIDNAKGTTLWKRYESPGPWSSPYYSQVHRSNGRVSFRPFAELECREYVESTGNLASYGGGFGFFDKISRNYTYGYPDRSLRRDGTILEYLSTNRYYYSFSDEKSIAYLVGETEDGSMLVARLNNL